MNFNPAELTFAKLDRQKGMPELDPLEADDFPLPAWHRAIYHKPLSEFKIEDICKSCRQKLHLEYIIPLALEFMKKDANAGELYDGELIVSLQSIPVDFWKINQENRQTLEIFIRKNMDNFDQEIRSDVRDILGKLENL